jgi:hypothetical protein
LFPGSQVLRGCGSSERFFRKQRNGLRSNSLLAMPPSADGSAWYQRSFLALFRLFGLVDRSRKGHPFGWHVITGTISFAAFSVPSYLNGLDKIGGPEWWPAIGVLTPGRVTVALIGLAGGTFLKFLFFDGLVSLLAYLPGTIANRELGFHAVALDETASIRFTAEQAKKHSRDRKVRVLCISGRFLFGTEQTPTGLFPPLKDMASSGLLDVVMPVSDPRNLTIAERFSTYTSETGPAIGISSIDDFVAEIDRGKKLLSKNSGNLLSEHNMLCMWRVVLFDTVCVVQNYFPNKHGTASYKAPTFVFEKVASSPNCYYEIFSNMFDIIKKTSQTRLPQDPPARMASSG